jgi:hypothetical protein
VASLITERDEWQRRWKWQRRSPVGHSKGGQEAPELSFVQLVRASVRLCTEESRDDLVGEDQLIECQQ